MITLDVAQQRLDECVRPLPAATVELEDALGCRLADAPRADGPLPPDDVSAMDGYAVRAADLERQARLPVAFEVPAGSPPAPLPAGATARIFTGGVLPNGADTVVPQEQAEVQPDGTVRLAALKPGKHVRRGGEVLKPGHALARVGDVVTPQRIALLAAGGAGRVSVIRRPRVAILLTGSEIVPVDARPGPGQIRDCNGPMLGALARRAGLHVAYRACVADDIEKLRDAVRQAGEQADIIVTCGGVSVGDYDLVPDAINDLGGEIIFHQVSIKPGKPILTARLKQAWVLGLPGNPVSSLVGWRIFGRPLANALAGEPDAFADTPEPAALTEPLTNRGERVLLQPALFAHGQPQGQVTPLPWKGSHDLATAARANALLHIAPGADHDAGDTVGCHRLD